MNITIQDDTPFKTIFSCIKMYIIVKRATKEDSEDYKLKGVRLYFGDREDEELDRELNCNNG